MNVNLKKFLDVLNKDKAVQEKFAAAKSPEEAFEIAAAIQGGYTFEELKDAMVAIQQSIKNELSDKDLDAVAGGARDFRQDRAAVISPNDPRLWFSDLDTWKL
jgi:predicted ribosomally synthesized peptide with nif11-like leader